MAENTGRERDLVLNPNEFAYVLDKTKGLISCIVGPFKMSLSMQDSLVVFDENLKRFVDADFDTAIKTFISAPENWYVELKNPTISGKHPSTGSSNVLDELQVGKKINIPGNVSFALYPGQMAKIIRGHRLHNNQYLLARVYDANILNKDIEDEDKKYTVGQLLIIKGTEYPFYIPTTGIEVVPVNGIGDKYVRDAVTLERLEYCILKDEEGNKKYIHGPNVVFPEPDELFIENPIDHSSIFKAIELSPISGIYVKVIADYTENGQTYVTGQELFITGDDTMIYYPRPEHSIISYEGKILHHAIAIPTGEGRYVLDRATGEISMIKGPSMFLPDPRKQVIVKRKLSKRQCQLWYPDNEEVFEYNVGKPDELDDINFVCSTAIDSFAATKAFNSLPDSIRKSLPVVTEATGIKRSNTYSKPRTITIDNKFDGVVALDVWTGYAVCVVSKSGKRKIVTGPTTILLEYDETLEEMNLSTGKPKTTNNLLSTVFLRVENNKISDIISVRTSDFVSIDIKLSYCVNFAESYKDKWFAVDNYVKYLTDRVRSLLKQEVKKYTLEEFYNRSSEIIRNCVLNNHEAIKTTSDDLLNYNNGIRLFKENGMFIHDVEVLAVNICDKRIADMIDQFQIDIVKQSLKLTNANTELEVFKALTEVEKEKKTLEFNQKSLELELNTRLQKDNIIKSDEIRVMKDQSIEAAKEAEVKLQSYLNDLNNAELEREKAKMYQVIDGREKDMELERITDKARADNIKQVIESISPALVSALQSASNSELVTKALSSVAPYALAKNESAADVANILLRGTSLESTVKDIISSFKYVDNKNNK